MGLKAYRQKRDPAKTPEPMGRRKPASSGAMYVIQKHDASRLHYDLRLELDGVLLSWAVPKGPSLDPRQRRLAVQVEDHPVEYGNFEGIIPEGQYGGGTVMLWDRGTWRPLGDARTSYRDGRLKFQLFGEKLRGGWMLTRMRGEDGKNWLLIKERDDEAWPSAKYDILKAQSDSVKSQRSLDDIAGSSDARWNSGKPSKRSRGQPTSGRHSRNGNPKRAPARPAMPEKLPGAYKASMPRSISPQLATLIDKPPGGDDWLHEIKFDGYRMLCVVRDGKARLITRNGKDWTKRFQEIADDAVNINIGNAILDGEVVVLNREGKSDFQALQNAMKSGRTGGLRYYVFDLPYCGDFDLRRVPLKERKGLLARLLAQAAEDSRLKLSEHIEGRGDEVFAQACELGTEGIVSKRVDSAYEMRRSRSWLKVKCGRLQEFVIGGYTDPSGSRVGFGALLLGYHGDDGDLVYCGRVGTGFNTASLKRLHARLKPLKVKQAPFANPPKGADARDVHYVKPELVGEVAFTEWTDDGLLRHPSFQGLREDKPAKDVGREAITVMKATRSNGQASKQRPAQRKAQPSTRRRTSGGSKGDDTTIAGVTLTHPDRVVYPDQQVTKRELAQYYLAVVDWILPHVANRPLSLVRCPQGRQGKCFYQKHVSETFSCAVQGVEIEEKEGKGIYISIRDAEGLITLVQFGALEIHPWASRNDRIERPDRMVFDLDPGPGVAWEQVVEAARLLRDRLDELGLVSFVKTSGGKGLHVMLPVDRTRTWEEFKAWAKGFTESVVAQAPKQYIANMSKSKRPGKIFIDYLRNGRGATSVAPYSTRARAGAPVSMPLRWEELTGDISPAHYDVRNASNRMSSLKNDPWEGFFELRQSITARAMRAMGL